MCVFAKAETMKPSLGESATVVSASKVSAEVVCPSVSNRTRVLGTHQPIGQRWGKVKGGEICDLVRSQTWNLKCLQPDPSEVQSNARLFVSWVLPFRECIVLRVYHVYIREMMEMEALYCLDIHDHPLSEPWLWHLSD